VTRTSSMARFRDGCSGMKTTVVGAGDQTEPGALFRTPVVMEVGVWVDAREAKHRFWNVGVAEGRIHKSLPRRAFTFLT
jgi:hypothetical protein